MAEEFGTYPQLLPGLYREDDGIWERYLTPDGRVALVISDCGPVNAAAAAERLIGSWAPEVLINSGSAGAHNPELLPGDVVIGSHYLVLDQPLTPTPFAHLRWRTADSRVQHERLEADAALVDLALQAAQTICAAEQAWGEATVWPTGMALRPPRAIVGGVGSMDDWTTDHARLRLLRERAGVESEDMESAYIAQVCAMHGVPFLAVRVISNNELHASTGGLDILGPIRLAGSRAARVVAALLTLLAAAA